jgi:hypothetical protein
VRLPFSPRFLRRNAAVSPFTWSLPRVAILVAALLLAVVVPGCGRSIPKTYPVKGKVLHKGGKPVTYGRVEFQSKPHPELRATGRIQMDGTFSLTTYLGGTNAQGAVEGEHSVFIELESRSAVVSLPVPSTVKPGDNDFTFEIPPPRR